MKVVEDRVLITTGKPKQLHGPETVGLNFVPAPGLREERL